MNFTALMSSISLLGGKIKTKLALKLDKADIDGRGLLTPLDMTAGAGLAIAQALPGALYGKGIIFGRAKASDLGGLTGPVVTGGKTGVLKIFAEINSGATGSTPFACIRREFSGSGGLMFVQYAVDATTWSAWQGVATTDGTIKQAQSFYLASQAAYVGTPIVASAVIQGTMIMAQVRVRATDDTNITDELIISNIATLDPLWSVSNTDVGILTMWTEATGTNLTNPFIRRELLINGRTLVSSALTTDSAWGAWTLKREIANTITVSTAAPSGGQDGDIWLQYS
jgi:hypothetical protein